MYDCIVIGAGVIGAAVSRELSKYRAKVLVLEKEEDLCAGTSKANSGLVHAGFDAKPGSLKAAMNVEGNAMMEQVCQELCVPFKRTGALVVAFNNEEEKVLEHLLEQGKENGVSELFILGQKELYEMEPGLAEGAAAGLYAKTAGVVCPFELTLAMAENAVINGVSFRFLSNILEIVQQKEENGSFYRLRAEVTEAFSDPQKGILKEEQIFEAKAVINCAGVYSDELHNMVSSEKYHITARKGEYCLLDETAGGHVSRTVFRVPGRLGKGILVTPTVHGNLLLGPTACDIQDKEGINTTAQGLSEVIAGAGHTVRNIPFKQVITSFAGLRAHEAGGDFILREAEGAAGFIDAVGIESPGLSAAPAIGRRLSLLAAEYLGLEKKADYIPYRNPVIRFKELSLEEQKKLIRIKPEYGNVICRCETVTEGEILEAVYRPLGAKSLDGIKRRVRAGMGRCQGGFCSPKVLEILAKAHKVPTSVISKAGPGTEILTFAQKGGALWEK